MRLKYTFYVLIICCVISFYTGYSYSQYNFYSGEEWIDIDKQDLPEEQKLFLKKIYLQAAQDSSIFSGGPIIPEGERDFNAYVGIMDRLYVQEENANLPLYFMFKIADMTRNNYPSQQVTLYRLAIMQQLERIGVVE
jgi:hypothetical protein